MTRMCRRTLQIALLVRTKRNSPSLPTLNIGSACKKSSRRFAASVRASMGGAWAVATKSTLSVSSRCPGRSSVSNASRI